MKKKVITLATVLLTFVMITALISTTACSFLDNLLGIPEELSPNDECKFYTAEELEELYFSNKESFKNVADAILASDGLLAYMNERDIPNYHVFDVSDERFFSEQEWKEIVDFFKMSHSSRVERSREVDDVICFEFIRQITDETNTAVVLYYFPQPTEEIVQHYSQSPYLTDYYQIDANWWILVSNVE